ncbi:major facilitator superfamily domain-containing protein [Collybia nuda]|uniref:Major facilitator superfamily domain-containing protein n=1 Tax=Collybia nuda TaxID=64659 RepID=A0A9P5XUI0_9AGAR|nr:major facilitator superfamily domain-containing protein [Collybia nuda]
MEYNGSPPSASDDDKISAHYASSPPPPPKRNTLKSVIIVMTCTFAMIVNSANNTSVSISLSSIAHGLSIQEAELQWLVSAYSLSSGCLLLMFGRLADLYGRKKTFLIGSFTLAAFTLGCGFSQNAITLDVLRGIQGIGVAATIPASIGILAHAFPPSRARSVAFATFAAGAPIGAAFGMALGGLLVQVTSQSWRSPFYLECGMTVLCFIGGLISIDKDLPSTEIDRRVDWIGALLVTAGLVLIVFVLGQGELAPQRWATPYIIAILIIGVLFVIIFIWWQWYLEKIQNTSSAPYSLWTPPPLMKLSLWGRARGRFAVMMCIAFLAWCAFLSWNFWVILYYQSYIGYSSLQTVVRLLPMFVSGVLCNVVVAFVVGRVSIVYLIVIGTLGSTGACLLFALIIPSVPYWAFGFPAAVISVIGADFVFASGTLFVAKVSLPHEQSLAGALFQTMTQLGTAVGLTVTTVVFNRVTLMSSEGRPTLKSYQAAQWTSFAFGMLATLLAIVFFRGVGVVGHQKPNFSGKGGASDIDHERTVVNTKLDEP